MSKKLASAFQHVNFLNVFCRKTCILQYPCMASKAWQKKNLQIKWIIKKNVFDQFFTSSIYCFQYRPKCRLPYFVVGCGSCPSNLQKANMNNTQLRYQVRIVWNGVNINTVLKNLVHTPYLLLRKEHQ